ncbi:ATP-binding protein [Streptomyces asiaticus]
MLGYKDNLRQRATFGVQATAEDVSMARRRVSSIVRSWGMPLDEEVLSDLELLSSELITNAIEHAGGACVVCVQRADARVRVEVIDGDPTEPDRAEAGPDDEGGRGLTLVTSLAADWGTRRSTAGKAVWFEIGPPNEWTSQPATPPKTLQVLTALLLGPSAR